MIVKKKKFYKYIILLDNNNNIINKGGNIDIKYKDNVKNSEQKFCIYKYNLNVIYKKKENKEINIVPIEYMDNNKNTGDYVYVMGQIKDNSIYHRFYIKKDLLSEESKEIAKKCYLKI